MRPACAIVLATTLLAGCATGGAGTPDSPSRNADDPDFRAFSGTIVSLRFTTSTMLISKEEKDGPVRVPNNISVKYDAQTQFFLDGQPTTLDKLDRYMPVKIEGHMRGGQLFAETARFSSVLPPGIKPSQVDPGPAPVTTRPR
jgi:hypothetical protein